MRGELIGEAAHFPPAHGVGLTGDGKGSHSRSADSSGREMHVDDRVDLIRSGHRLIDALRIDRHHAFCPGEHVEEGFRQFWIDPALFRGPIGHVHAGDGGGGDRVLQPRGMIAGPQPVDGVHLVQIGQQAVEQGDVGARGDRQMQIGGLGRGGAAGVDDDDFRAPCVARGQQALMQHRMAPGGVAAHQHHQIGLFPVAVDSGDDILAKRADMTGDGGRHAQARIRIDIGGTDEAFHQLVGGVIILGQALAGDIKGDAVRPVHGDGLAESRGDEAKRVVPGRVPPANAGFQQAPRVFQRRRQGSALGAKPSAIGGMRGVTRDDAVRFRHDPTADAAIGAGRVDIGTGQARCARGGREVPVDINAHGARSPAGRRSFLPASCRLSLSRRGPSLSRRGLALSRSWPGSLTP